MEDTGKDTDRIEQGWLLLVGPPMAGRKKWDLH